MIKQYEYETKELLELITSCVTDEGYNSKATIKLAYYQNNELVGICVFDELSINDKRYPDFNHVYIRKDKRKTSALFRMLKEAYKLLKENGYDQIISYTFNRNEHIQRMLKKNGYVEYGSDDNGKHYYKNL